MSRDRHADQRAARSKLDAALDKGSLPELPPNRPHGVLGHISPDMRKIEDFDMGSDTGVSQEIDMPVVILAIILSYVLFFPIAFVIVWRTRRLNQRVRVILSAAMTAGIIVVGYQLVRG